MGVRRLTRAQLLNDIRRVARILGHAPRCDEYRQHGIHTPDVLRDRFGCWVDTMKAAGLRYENNARIPDQQVKDDLLRVQNLVGQPPTNSEYKSRGRFSCSTLERRAQRHVSLPGWAPVLIHFLGLSEPEARYWTLRNRGRAANGSTMLSRDEWILRIRNVAQRLGRSPSWRDAKSFGMCPGGVKRGLGVSSWRGVLLAAGLDIHRLQGASRTRSSTDDELYEDIVSVARRLRKLPSKSAYAKLGSFSLHAITTRLGRWSMITARIARQLGWIKYELTDLIRPLGEVPDPTREFLKNASVEDVKDWRQNADSR